MCLRHNHCSRSYLQQRQSPPDVAFPRWARASSAEIDAILSSPVEPPRAPPAAVAGAGAAAPEEAESAPAAAAAAPVQAPGAAGHEKGHSKVLRANPMVCGDNNEVDKKSTMKLSKLFPNQT